MDGQIYWILEVAIQPGQLENFKSVANDLIASAKSESGTLNYEWNLSADKTVCHIYERYANSAAILIHVQSIGQFAKRFMEACRPTRFHVYGSPSAKVKAALADLNPVYLSHLAGFSR